MNTPFLARFPWRARLPANVASASYDADVHETCAIVERVDDAVVSHANAPQVGGPLELDATMRPWILRQSPDTCDDSSRHAGLETFEFVSRRAREDDRVLSHAAAGDPVRAS